jgi:hypothetical protein
MFHRRRLRFTLSAFCVGMFVLHGMILWHARDQAIAGAPDLRNFYTAGLMLRRGQGDSLYDDALQRKTQREFVSPGSAADVLLPYIHPPFEAILFLPLTFLTFLHAYLLSFLLNGVLLAVGIYVIRWWIPAIAADLPELLFLAPLAFFPVFYAFLQGQDSILLLTLYCLAYAAFRRGRDLQAGIWLGLGLFKFHLILPFAVILLLCRRWRAIAGIVATGCCELAISGALVGWREFLYYPRYAWHVNRLGAKAFIFPENMPNLRGLLTGWTESPALRLPLELLLFAVSLSLLVWAARRWQWTLTKDDAWDTGFSIAVVATFLVGYYGYNQDLSILLLPILLTFNRMLQHSAPGAALRVIVGLLFFSPLYVLLTFVYGRQHLFALVLLAFVFSLAALRGRPAAVNSDRVRASDSRHRLQYTTRAGL